MEVLTVHGNELRLFLGQGSPPTLTIDVTRLTYQQQIQFLTSLVYVVWSRLKPDTSPTANQHVTNSAIGAGYYVEVIVHPKTNAVCGNTIVKLYIQTFF